MEVNGYQIREAIKNNTEKRDLLISLFVDSGFQFNNAIKERTPTQISEELEKVNNNIAILESLQQKFNTEQIITVNNKTIQLSVAIKLIASYGRLANLWKEYAKNGLLNMEQRYGTDSLVRKNDEIRATRVVSVEECATKASYYTKQQLALRSAIASANGRVIEIDDETSINCFK